MIVLLVIEMLLKKFWVLLLIDWPIYPFTSRRVWAIGAVTHIIKLVHSDGYFIQFPAKKK
jgi:hypothetical protein